MSNRFGQNECASSLSHYIVFHYLEPFRVDHFKSGPATTELLVLSPDDFRDDYRESEGNMEVGDRMSPEHEPMVRSKQRNGDNRGGTTA